jgi:outer membrane receptor for ferrienterochelin and colicin
MSAHKFHWVLAVAALWLWASPAAAQQRPGSLQVSVYDTTGAAIIATNVVITLPDGSTVEQLADERGTATFPELVPGRYTVYAEFPGFEPAVLEMNVRAGRQTRQDITLEIAGYVEEISVEQDTTDRQLFENFGQVMTAADIEALPDDPDELAQVLQEMAGPGAVIRVNGFDGGQLPPKSQIRQIRFRFDPFGAEYHDAGRARVDIITKPGDGPIRNDVNLAFRDNSLDARNALSPVRGEGQTKRWGWSIDGPIVKGKTGFSLSLRGVDQFDVQTVRATTPTGQVNQLVTQPTDRLNIDFNVEHVLSQNNTLRFAYDRSTNTQTNLGVGDFDLPERAFNREGTTHQVRLSNFGTFNRKYLNETRVQYRWNESQSFALNNAQTIRVQDTGTWGGAQVEGGTRSWEAEIANILDIPVNQKHNLRTGFEARTGDYRADQISNFAGTFTFPSLDAYYNNQPINYTERVIADPLVRFRNTELAMFVQDDIRVRKNLLLSLGVRQEMQTLIDQKLNVAPRLGLSWSPFASNKTTIRGGAGIFYDWYETSIYEQTLRVDGERQQDLIIRNPGFPNPYEGGNVSVIPPSRIQADNLNMPTVRRWSVGVEQTLTDWLRLRTNYFNQYGWNQFRARNINAPIDGLRPIDGLGNITQLESTGTAESHGLDMNVNFNYRPRRLFGNVGYTIAQRQNFTDSALSLPVNNMNIDAEWGPAGDDIRHRIFAFVTTDMFWGLRAGVNVRAQSGRPYTLTTGFDDNADGVVNDRPFGVGRNTERLPWQQSVDLRLSWSKGLGPLRGGAGGRGEGPGGGGPIIMGPPGGGGDAAMQRGPGGGGGGRFGGPGGETRAVRLELYLQTFNLLNNVNFTRYSAALSSPIFGAPIAAMPPRRLEMGMRVGF